MKKVQAIRQSTIHKFGSCLDGDMTAGDQYVRRLVVQTAAHKTDSTSWVESSGLIESPG